MISQLMQHIDAWRARRLIRTSRHRRALERIPAGLYEYWKNTAHREFKGIPRDAFFFARAAEGLLDFFDCKRFDMRNCGLPSKAADSVWHAWMRYSPASLDALCILHVGRTLVHIDQEAMGQDADAAMARTLVFARGLDSLPRAGPALPSLFRLDRALRMPLGFAYRIASGEVAWQVQDRRGRPEGTFIYPDALTPPALLASGLISQTEYLDYQQRSRASGSGDASFSFSGGDCDAGGSCGGGCGGGD
ncbi:MAG: hypothetical protein V4723_07955 [Pseudomonadota bacterium]